MKFKNKLFDIDFNIHKHNWKLVWRIGGDVCNYGYVCEECGLKRIEDRGICGKVPWEKGDVEKYRIKNTENCLHTHCEIQQMVRNAANTQKIHDGYHSFEELYHHRAVLFATICKTYSDKSWKSKLHHDGTMYDNYFIVGCETVVGQYTYHYDMKYWDMFDVKEIDMAPEWDGHKPEDVIRLLTLEV